MTAAPARTVAAAERTAGRGADVVELGGGEDTVGILGAAAAELIEAAGRTGLGFGRVRCCCVGLGRVGAGCIRGAEVGDASLGNVAVDDLEVRDLVVAGRDVCDVDVTDVGVAVATVDLEARLDDGGGVRPCALAVAGSAVRRPGVKTGVETGIDLDPATVGAGVDRARPAV